VQAAFLGGLVLPPPAARPEVLAEADRPRAGRAADAGEELVVQRVVVDLVDADVVPDVAPGPVGERIDLGAGFARVDLRDFSARGRLLAPQARVRYWIGIYQVLIPGALVVLNIGGRAHKIVYPNS